MFEDLKGVFPVITEICLGRCYTTALNLSQVELAELQGRRIGFERLLEQVDEKPSGMVQCLDPSFRTLKGDEEFRRKQNSDQLNKGKKNRTVNQTIRIQNMRVQEYRADRTLLYSPGISL